MSFDNLISTQIDDALAPVLSKLNLYIDKFAKTEAYSDVQIGASEAARLLNRSVAMIHVYVDEGQLVPVNPHEKCKRFTLKEIDRFRSDTQTSRRKSL